MSAVWQRGNVARCEHICKRPGTWSRSCNRSTEATQIKVSCQLWCTMDQSFMGKKLQITRIESVSSATSSQ